MKKGTQLVTFPKKVLIHEVGPREGFQFEEQILPTYLKAGFIESLAQTGLQDIEVASFVRPDRVPQMADAEALVASLRTFPGVDYTGTYLNMRGLQRAILTGKLRIKHGLTVAASDTFSQKNQNATIDESLQQLRARAEYFSQNQISSVSIGVATAFGCNYEGDVALTKVVDLLKILEEIALSNHLKVSQVRLLDTMGWATPKLISQTIDAVQQLWPKTAISLHLHDTRGLGMVNAYEALSLGVSDFDTSIAGMGGCPFAGHKGAAGNVATEDFVLLCHELGIETGIDLDALIKCALAAEDLVGHPLPGKVRLSGSLSSLRK